MQKYLPNDNDTANYYYFLLNDLLNNKEASPGERLLFLKTYLTDFFKEITRTEKQFFSNDFARLVFVLDSNSSNPSLSFKVKQIYFFLKSISRYNLEKLTPNNLSECIYIFSLLVKHLTAVPIPYVFFELHDKITFDITAPSGDRKFTDRIKLFRATVKTIDLDKKELKLVSEDLDEDVSFYPQGIWSNIVFQCRIGTTLNLIDIVKKDDTFFTGPSSIVVLEPDYLFDATEIAEAFDFSGFNAYRLLLRRIQHHSGSIHLIIGHIINYIFDTLLINPSVDFEDVYFKSLKSRILPLFAAVIDAQENKKLIREKALTQFENLRQLVLQNNFGKLAIEPSFISHLYGFQGRMDLIVEDRENDYIKHIYELKSGSPAKIDSSFTKDGTFIKTGTYINHFAQVTIYNILLESCYPKRKGSSAILYSKDDSYPLRNVPNFKSMKQDMIQARNEYLALEYKLAEGDSSIFNMLNPDNFPKAAYWVKDDFADFHHLYINLSDVLRIYYTTWLKFISNELFAVKVGVSTRGDGHAGLWRKSLESKKLSGELISSMKLLADESDFEAMHLVFAYSDSSDNAAQFKKGDICIIYPDNPDSEFSPNRGRLIKCSIKEIVPDKVFLSLRNKLQFEIFDDAETKWHLDFDSSDSAVKSLYKSISYFINASDDKKNIILGLKPPEISKQSYSPPPYLSDDKIELYKSAMNAKDYYLIQGPPGTGKTKYMLRALVEGIYRHTEQNILLLAYTNRAVDEICDALKLIKSDDDTSFEFIRLGNKDSSVHKEHLLSEIVENHDLNSLFKKIKKIRVFAATVSFAQSNAELFSLKQFHTSIVDEASQITECNLVGVLARVNRFILIGDEKQLPAIVIQDDSKLIVEDKSLLALGLSKLNISLFERLLFLAKRNKSFSCFGMLHQQARMHANVMEFPNKYFYDNKLKVFNSEKQTAEETIFSADKGFLSAELASKRFIFINTPAELHPKYNLAETECVIKLLDTIERAYNKNFDETKVGVISPFRLQCATVRKNLSEKQHELVSVDTVERFQGSEREIIILSTAVNNSYLLNNAQSLVEIDGNLIDRKLNVAITRAKSHVVILGNESILRNSPIYSELIDFCKSKGAFIEYNCK